MTLGLEDQESILYIKEKWNNWGRWIFYIIIALMVIFLFKTIYNGYNSHQNEKAASLFEKFLSLNLSNKNINSLKVLKQLQQKYPKSISSSKATLIVAGNSFEFGKLDIAKKHLQWVINNQKEPNIKSIAILRFANVLMQEQKYKEALEFLEKNKIDNFYEYVKLDLQGDIYSKLGQKDKAIESYNKASSNIEDSAIKEYFRIKSNI